MREGKPIVKWKDDALAWCAEIEKASGPALRNIVRRVKKQISRYRPRRISTLGHVRVAATAEKLDEIIMMASGGAAVRHFNRFTGVVVEDGDGIDNEMIEDSLNLLDPSPGQAVLSEAAGMNLRDEAARAVALNWAFIEDLADALEQRTRLDILEIEAVLAVASTARNAVYTRVRPPAKAR